MKSVTSSTELYFVQKMVESEGEEAAEREPELQGQPEQGAAPPDAEPSVEELTTKELGDLGEQIAVTHLESIGYEIVERNYRCPEGEADIVAYDPAAECIVMVEVKTRRRERFDDGVYPEEAVNKKKRRRYRRIAACYVMQNFPLPSVRFDVIAVTVLPKRLSRVHHIVGAFDWEAGI